MTDDLISKIVDELLDPEYSTRTHGYRTTYKAGCKGPLCMKAERDRATQKRDRRHPDRKPPHRTEYFVQLDAFLEKVIKALGLHERKQGSKLADQAGEQAHESAFVAA